MSKSLFSSEGIQETQSLDVASNYIAFKEMKMFRTQNLEPYLPFISLLMF